MLCASLSGRAVGWLFLQCCHHDFVRARRGNTQHQNLQEGEKPLEDPTLGAWGAWTEPPESLNPAVSDKVLLKLHLFYSCEPGRGPLQCGLRNLIPLARVAVEALQRSYSFTGFGAESRVCTRRARADTAAQSCAPTGLIGQLLLGEARPRSARAGAGQSQQRAEPFARIARRRPQTMSSKGPAGQRTAGALPPVESAGDLLLRAADRVMCQKRRVGPTLGFASWARQLHAAFRRSFALMMDICAK